MSESFDLFHRSICLLNIFNTFYNLLYTFILFFYWRLTLYLYLSILHFILFSETNKKKSQKSRHASVAETHSTASPGQQEKEIDGNHSEGFDVTANPLNMLRVPQDTIQPPLQRKLRIGVRKVKATMYNYGSPRVGNAFFAALYNSIVPDSFRTVIDGDLVTSMPPYR